MEQGLTDRIQVIHGDGSVVLDELIQMPTGNTDPLRSYFIDAAKSHYGVLRKSREAVCSKNALIICDNIFDEGFLVDLSLDRKRRHENQRKKNE